MIAPMDGGAALFGRTRQAVLSLLLRRPHERFHLRQVVRLTGAGMGAVQREVRALVAAGVLAREESGRQVYYQARADSPFFPELQGLIVKTCGAAASAMATRSPARSWTTPASP